MQSRWATKIEKPISSLLDNGHCCSYRWLLCTINWSPKRVFLYAEYEKPDRWHIRKTFDVLESICKNHLNHFDWFVRAVDDAYIKVDLLLQHLSTLDKHEKVSIIIKLYYVNYLMVLFPGLLRFSQVSVLRTRARGHWNFQILLRRTWDCIKSTTHDG
jgi:hypothetical protein